MTDSYGPYEVAPWGESDWLDFAFTWAQSGVIGTPATAPTSGELAFASSGLNVSAGPGKAWVRGTGFKRTGTPPTHAAGLNSHASFSRRDRLVLRRDPANNQTVTAILQGTPAATPTPPPPTQLDGGVWEMLLHSFLVPPNNGTTITGVIDERQWLTDTPISGKMWRTSGGQALTSTLTKVGMDTARANGLTFDDANDELVLSAAGQYQMVLNGYVSAGSGDGYFAINRKRPSVSDLIVLFGDFTKPPGGDKRANASLSSLPLAAGDRLSLMGVGPTGVNALGTTEFQGCSLEVRYIAPLNGADPI